MKMINYKFEVVSTDKYVYNIVAHNHGEALTILNAMTPEEGEHQNLDKVTTIISEQEFDEEDDKQGFPDLDLEKENQDDFSA